MRISWQLDVVQNLARVASGPDDDGETRLNKTLLLVASLMMATLAIFWGSLYLINGERLAAAIPLTYALLSYGSILVFLRIRRYNFLRFSQLLLILLLPFLLMLALGNFVTSSAVILWSLMAPLGALLFASRQSARGWFVAYAALLIIASLWAPFGRSANSLSPALIGVFFTLNILGVSLVAFVLVNYFVREKNRALRLLGLEQQRSERLLLNVLPREIAAILKEEERTIADQHDEASILFADMVGFTQLSEEMAPRDLVRLLNDIFSHFDALVEKYNVEKIRTIGDNYMVAAGVPRAQPQHARLLVEMALEMKSFLQAFRDRNEVKPQFRIGINSGPVMAGVIGRKKFQYDVWGDAVNVASRMESHGIPGEIQIAQTTYELVKEQYRCTPRGKIDVKGKGKMAAWRVVGPARSEAMSGGKAMSGEPTADSNQELA